MFGFLWFFTIYIFWHFSNQSIAVAKCRCRFGRFLLRSSPLDFGNNRTISPGVKRQKRQTEIAGSTTWLGREFVVEAVVVAQHCGPGPCDTLWYVKTRFIFFIWYFDILWYVSLHGLMAWPCLTMLDHAWPVQILSTYDRASKRGWVSFSVCLVKSCEAGIEVILKLCWTSHFILGLLSNGKIERMRQSKCAMRQFHKIWNDFQFVAKLQFA